MYFPTANSLQNLKRMNTNLTGFKSLLGHTNIGPYHQIKLFFLGNKLSYTVWTLASKEKEARCTTTNASYNKHIDHVISWIESPSRFDPTLSF